MSDDQPVKTFGAKYEHRGHHPNSLLNLARGREKLRAKPVKRTNSLEHMAKMRAAKAAKQVQPTTGETQADSPLQAAPTTSSPWAHILPRSAEGYIAPAPETREEPKPETLDSFTVVPLTRRTAGQFEHLRYPNGHVTRRRLGSVPVVRVHVLGRERWWAQEPDALLDESQLDPVVVAGPYDPVKDYAAARAMQDHEHKCAGRVSTPGWGGTRRSWFHDLMDKGV